MPKPGLIRSVRLTLTLDVYFDEHTHQGIRFLVDTGADINLLRKGLVDPKFLTPAKYPLEITTVSRSPMEGGSLETYAWVYLSGTDQDTREIKVLKCPAQFYEADIGVEGILCYEWLATFDLTLRPHKNCMQWVDSATKSWVIMPGIRQVPVAVRSVTRIETPCSKTTKPTRPGKREERLKRIPRNPRVRRMLDLYSGTGSVGEVFRKMGYEVITVDFDFRAKPSIIVDITIWQYWKAFHPRFFDVP